MKHSSELPKCSKIQNRSNQPKQTIYVKEKANIHMFYCIFKWMGKLSQTVSSFASTSLCLIVFLFCMYFCLLSHLEIIDCYFIDMKSLIATSTYFCWYTTRKRKLEKCFLGAEVWAPKSIFSMCYQKSMLQKKNNTK